MNNIHNSGLERTTPTSNSLLGSAPVPPDAYEQGVLKTQELYALIKVYLTTADSADKAALLKQIMALYSQFSLGPPVSFQYTAADGSTQTITVPESDKDTTKIFNFMTHLSNPPTNAELQTFVDQYDNYPGGSQDAPFAQISEWFLAHQIDSSVLASNPNNYAPMVYLKIAMLLCPAVKLAIAGEWLSQGEYGAFGGNMVAFARMINALIANNLLDPAIANAIFATPIKDLPMATTFFALCKEFAKDPNQDKDIKDIFNWELRYYEPDMFSDYSPSSDMGKPSDSNLFLFVPEGKHTDLEKRAELSKEVAKAREEAAENQPKMKKDFLPYA